MGKVTIYAAQGEIFWFKLEKNNGDVLQCLLKSHFPRKSKIA